MSLDPHEINPAAVQAELLRLSDLLSHATQETRKRAIAKAEADSEHTVAKAHAMAGAEGTVQEREAQVALATQAEYRALRNAEAVLASVMEANRNLRQQISALQSINVNLRELVG